MYLGIFQSYATEDVTCTYDTPGECQESYEQLCSAISLAEVLFQPSQAFDGTWWFDMIGILSLAGETFLFLVIYLTPQLQAHPQKLFMYIALVEGANFGLIIYSKYSCALHAPDLLALTLSGSTDEVKRYINLQLIVASWQAQGAFLWAISFILNCALCIDLILMIKYPFSSNESRLWKYVVVSVLYSFYLGLWALLVNQTGDYLFWGGIQVVGVMFFFMAVAVGSISYAGYHLSRPGISREVRGLILKRHVAYIVLFIIVNLYWAQLAIIFVKKDLEALKTDNWFRKMNKLTYFSQGIFMPILRLNEPLFLEISKDKVKKWFSCCRRQEKLPFEDSMLSHETRPTASTMVKEKELTPLFLFLASSLNVELVYTILKSVCQFSYIDFNDENNINGKFVHTVKKNLTFIRDLKTRDLSVTIAKIKIKNLSLWEDKEATDFQQDGHIDMRQTATSYLGSRSSYMSTNQSMNTSTSSQPQADVISISTSVKVTWHNITAFRTMFPFFCNSTDRAEVLHQSLSPKNNRHSVFKSGEGAGKSGSFFFFSHDKKFIIKTMTPGELKLFLRLLPKFKDHYAENPQSLLARIFGAFTVEQKGRQKVHLMIMENTLSMKPQQELKHIFDLKGSTVARFVKGKKFKPTETLKDINFMQVAQDYEKKQKNLEEETMRASASRSTLVHRDTLTSLKESTRRKLLRIMRKDVEFLRANGLMDYSMLVAVQRENENLLDKQVTTIRNSGLQRENESLLDESTTKIDNSGATALSDSTSLGVQRQTGTEELKESKLAKRSSTLISMTSDGPDSEIEVDRETAVANAFPNHAFSYKDKTIHLAIIDYLQEWNCKKRMERVSKTMVLQKDGKKLSAIEPNQYAARFQLFMEQNVFV